MGGGGVFCWDHRYYIYGQMTSYISDVPNNDGKEMELINYGATIGYIFFPQNKIHFSSGIQFAYNNIKFRESNKDISEPLLYSSSLELHHPPKSPISKNSTKRPFEIPPPPGIAEKLSKPCLSMNTVC